LVKPASRNKGEAAGMWRRVFGEAPADDPPVFGAAHMVLAGGTLQALETPFRAGGARKEDEVVMSDQSTALRRPGPHLTRTRASCHVAAGPSTSCDRRGRAGLDHSRVRSARVFNSPDAGDTERDPAFDRSKKALGEDRVSAGGFRGKSRSPEANLIRAAGGSAGGAVVTSTTGAASMPRPRCFPGMGARQP